MKSGRLVELPEEDIETGNTPSSSFCCLFKESNDEDVIVTVTNEVEDVQIIGDIIDELASDIVKSNNENSISNDDDIKLY